MRVSALQETSTELLLLNTNFKNGRIWHHTSFLLFA